MNRLSELATQLTLAQLKEVVDFAEFLLACPSSFPSTALQDHFQKVDVNGLTGLCKGMGGDMTDKELIREAWGGIVAKSDR